MFKKPPVVLLIIVVLGIGSILINLPKIPLNFTLGSIKIDRIVENPNINLRIFDFEFVRDLNLKLGLDLQGGTNLTRQANVENIPAQEREKALEAVKEVIERRVNFFGISEPVVQTSKVGESEFRIIVDLPGVTDLDKARDLIGQTAKLELREFKDPNTPQGTFPTLENTKPSGVAGMDIKSATADIQTGDKGQGAGTPVVRFELNDAGAKKFKELTKRLIGKPLVIFLDDIPVSAPTVQSEIEREGVITGMSAEEAKTLAVQLSAGALPVEKIEIVSEKNIGPTLGKKSISERLVAGIVGLVTLLVFMILYYRLPGVLAGIALLLYSLFILSLFRLIPVTLTLSGIAGFILSIGMAVDANILIFERMKEKLRDGKKTKEAASIGFSRAWLSIRDGNFPSILSAIILFWFGSSLIEGFALTFGLGVLVSMLSAIIISRTFMFALGNYQNRRLTRALFGSGTYF